MKNSVRNKQKIGRDYRMLEKDDNPVWIFLIRPHGIHEKVFNNKLDAEIFARLFAKKYELRIYWRYMKIGVIF